MKKIFLAALTIAALLSVKAHAQLTVSTLPTIGLHEPYNIAEDANYNIYISDSANNRIVMINGNNQAQITLAGTTGSPGATDGPYYAAQFNDPQGLLAVTINGTNGLLVADTGNQLIRFVRSSDGYVTTLAGKVGVSSLIDNAVGTNATFTAPYGLTQDTNGNVYIADLTAGKIRVMNLNDPNFGVSTMTISGTSLYWPQAVAFMGTNQLWVADTGNNTIKLITLTSTTAGSLTTYIGSNDSRTPGTTDSLFGSNARFNLPCGVLWIPNFGLLISDTGNSSIRLATNNPTFGATNYSVLTYAGTSGTHGSTDGSLSSALFYSPKGLCLDPVNSAFLVADMDNNSIRRVLDGLPPPPPPAPVILTVTTSTNVVNLTWAKVSGATSYNVKRSTSSSNETWIANTTGTNYSDTSVLNGKTYYYVISAVNTGGEANSTEVTVTVPFLRVNPPVIGFLSKHTDPATGQSYWGFISVRSDSSTPPFYDDTLFKIAISCPANPDTPNVQYKYTSELELNKVPLDPDSPSATPNTFTSWPTNGDSSPDNYQIPGKNEIQPNITIKVQGIGVSTNQPDSLVVSANFKYVVANPSISGNNAAGFVISDITPGARLYYTTDGSDPSDPANTNRVDWHILPDATNSWPQIKLTISSNTLFQAWASKDNYFSSSNISKTFDLSAFQPATITFGLTNNEPHSSFLARPGQIFYAPVTLLLPPGFGNMYSLQFNVAVTNGLANTNTGFLPPPVQNGAGMGFFSMLVSKVPSGEGPYLPPADGQNYLAIPASIIFGGLGAASNTIPTIFTNGINNLLGVGWFYRYGLSYKWAGTDEKGNTIVLVDFATSSQDLITYSIPHDTLFNKSGRIVVAGAFSFQVPSGATNGDQYFIQLGSPSATSDGVGDPGSAIPIVAPASSQVVTVGSPRYLVGDAAPFRWLNAGDFGDNNLDNSDVMQVYQAIIFSQPIDPVPTNSDLYLAMDSAGGLDNVDTNIFYEANTTPNTNNMWNGNDSTINQMPFGDGQLDINDLYVTFRRSVDPSLLWFERNWTNENGIGQFVAVVVTNKAYNINTPHALVATPKAVNSGDYQKSLINFTANDIQTSAGQTVQVPIYANVIGDYPLRVLGLDVKVVPLDGSPDITQPVIFSAAAGLGNPTLPPITRGSSEIGAAWLDSTIAGLSGNALIGTLSVTLPTNATAASAYAVHFAKVSGSPNGLAIFPKNTLTGLITLSSRTNSSYGDGIPDAWRLRWFGTVNNYLSLSNACASGDGINNWKKYVAGVDPNVANNFPSVNPKTPVPSGSTTAIHWPTVSGKQYAIERSASLFPGSWTTITTNTGTGTDMEFDDSPAGTANFYRVRILP